MTPVFSSSYLKIHCASGKCQQSGWERGKVWVIIKREFGWRIVFRISLVGGGREGEISRKSFF